MGPTANINYQDCGETSHGWLVRSQLLDIVGSFIVSYLPSEASVTALHSAEQILFRDCGR